MIEALDTSRVRDLESSIGAEVDLLRFKEVEDWEDVELPEPMVHLMEEWHRYTVFYGGRGGAKSWNVARCLLLLGLEQPLLILCVRELQNAIKDSVLALLSNQIDLMGLRDEYTVLKTEIIGKNGTKFIFKGMRSNASEIKSSEGIDIAWAEEAEAVSKASWDALIPTLRKDGSRIVVTFNPRSSKDDTYRRFITNRREDMMTVEMGWRQNPWLPKVLLDELEAMKKSSYEDYLHIWEGKTIEDAGTSRFRKDWVEFWPAGPIKNVSTWITVDPANSKKKGSDYTVFTVWHLAAGQKYFVRTWVRARLDLAQRVNTLFDLVREFKPVGVIYEHYGIQADVQAIEAKQRDTGFYFKTIPVGGIVRKEDRIMRWAPVLRERRLYVPETCMRYTEEGQTDMTQEFFKELIEFPFSEHDDILDCMARILESGIGVYFPQAPHSFSRKGVEMGEFDDENAQNTYEPLRFGL